MNNHNQVWLKTPKAQAKKKTTKKKNLKPHKVDIIISNKQQLIHEPHLNNSNANTVNTLRLLMNTWTEQI